MVIEVSIVIEDYIALVLFRAYEQLRVTYTARYKLYYLLTYLPTLKICVYSVGLLAAFVSGKIAVIWKYALWSISSACNFHEITYLMNSNKRAEKTVVEHNISVSEGVELARRESFGGVEIQVLQVWNANRRHAREIEHVPTEHLCHVDQLLYEEWLSLFSFFF